MIQTLDRHFCIKRISISITKILIYILVAMLLIKLSSDDSSGIVLRPKYIKIYKIQKQEFVIS